MSSDHLARCTKSHLYSSLFVSLLLHILYSHRPLFTHNNSDPFDRCCCVSGLSLSQIHGSDALHLRLQADRLAVILPSDSVGVHTLQYLGHPLNHTHPVFQVNILRLSRSRTHTTGRGGGLVGKNTRKQMEKNKKKKNHTNKKKK